MAFNDFEYISAQGVEIHEIFYNGGLTVYAVCFPAGHYWTQWFSNDDADGEGDVEEVPVQVRLYTLAHYTSTLIPSQGVGGRGGVKKGYYF